MKKKSEKHLKNERIIKKKLKYSKAISKDDREKKIIIREKNSQDTRKKEKTSSTKKVMASSTNEDDLNFTNKEHLIDELAVRWWYALPKWPPLDYDYTHSLRERGLRRVEIKNWKLEQEEQDGLRKVFELETFPGVFKDSIGKQYDLRPMESCPSLNNFSKMEKGRL